MIYVASEREGDNKHVTGANQAVEEDAAGKIHKL